MPRADRALHRWVLLGLLLFAAVLLSYYFSSGVVSGHDDACISFVYARNLAQGEGLVFNRGERVWGYTSPAQVLLLGCCGALGLDISRASVFCGILFIALSAFMVFKIVVRFLPTLPAILVAAHLVANPIGQYGFMRMETSFLVFTQLLFLHAILRKKFGPACLLAALSCLVRPDSLVLVLPVLLLEISSLRLRHLACFALPGLAWVAFAFAYYHDVLPNTFHAKAGHTAFTEYFSFIFTRTFHYRTLTEILRLPEAWGIAAGFAVSGSCLLCLKARPHRSLLYALLVYPWVLITAYGIIGSPKYHTWEIFPARFFFWFSIMFGLLALVSRSAKLLAGPMGVNRSGRALMTVFLLVWLFCIVVPDAGGLLVFLRNEEQQYWRGKRHKTYVRIAEWLNRNVPYDEALAAHEVGTLGYHTNIRLIDLQGLVTRSPGSGDTMSPDEIIERQRPRYLLQRKAHIKLRFRKDLEYRPLRNFKADGYHAFVLLERVH